jgi:hypothetical protein
MVNNYYFYIGHNLNENPDNELSFRGHIWMVNLYETAKSAGDVWALYNPCRFST